MSESMFVVWALLAGMDWRVVVILGVSIAFPVWTAIAIGIYAVRHHRAPSANAAVFCHAVASELRSGMSLRWALSAASRSAGAPDIATRLETGDRMESVVMSLKARYRDIGEELGVLVGSVQRGGGSSAVLFEELGDLALLNLEINEEVRVATAPVRGSVATLLVFPLAYLGYLISTDRLQGILSESAQRGFAVAGIGLIALGVTAIYVFTRRSL